MGFSMFAHLGNKKSEAQLTYTRSTPEYVSTTRESSYPKRERRMTSSWLEFGCLQYTNKTLGLGYCTLKTGATTSPSQKVGGSAAPFFSFLYFLLLLFAL